MTTAERQARRRRKKQSLFERLLFVVNAAANELQASKGNRLTAATASMITSLAGEMRQDPEAIERD